MPVMDLVREAGMDGELYNDLLSVSPSVHGDTIEYRLLLNLSVTFIITIVTLRKDNSY